MNTLTIRYKYIKDIVNNIYLKLNIAEFPIDIINIIRSFDNIAIVSYHQFMIRFNLTKEETFGILNSDEGCTDYKKDLDRYIIYYNDLDNKSEERIRWTLTHELGHILCCHYSADTKIFSGRLTESDYKFREAEANYFTSLLLSNPIILHKLSIRSSYDIEVYCALSSEAARYRFDNYKRWRKNVILSKSDVRIIQNFQNYLNTKTQEYQDYIAFMRSF